MTDDSVRRVTGGAERVRVWIYDDRVKIPPHNLELGPLYFNGLTHNQGTHALLPWAEFEAMRRVVEAALEADANNYEEFSLEGLALAVSDYRAAKGGDGE